MEKGIEGRSCSYDFQTKRKEEKIPSRKCFNGRIRNLEEAILLHQLCSSLK